MGRWVAEEAEAEGRTGFGPRAADSQVRGLLQRGSRQHARRNKPLAFNRLNAAYMEVPISIQRASQQSQNHWKRHGDSPKWDANEPPFKKGTLGSPRKVHRAKHGVSGEQCEDGRLQAQSPWEGAQRAERQSFAGTCRSWAPRQNWPGKFLLLSSLFGG